MKKMRVRYAPSPTGLLHIGNARTALFNYVFARHYETDYVIRIEDTDRAREVEGGEESQLKNLAWLGIDWDESPREPNPKYAPYRQSERLDIYHRYALQLINEGKAYWSYMTKEEQDAEREIQKTEREKEGLPPLYKHKYEYEGMSDEEIKASQKAAQEKGIKPCIRLRLHPDHTYAWDDMVKGHISFRGQDVGEGDWIIEKADGTATYNFCVVLDDHLMDITHVIRGDDHVNNTPKQLMVYEAFGWDVPKMAHMPLVLNAATGKKLSKRDKNTLQFIEDYREKGFLSGAVFNFIASLGWNPGGNEEILSREEILKLFTIERMSGAPAAFDQNKLNWINQQYIKKLTEEEYFDFVRPFMEKAGRLSETASEAEITHIKKITGLFRPQLQYGEEIIELTDIFFDEAIRLHEAEMKVLREPEAKSVIESFYDKLKILDASEITEEKVGAIVKETQKETGTKGKALWMPIRVAVSRQTHGPGLDEFIVLLGLEGTLRHIEKTLTEF